jgi:hypothetical protein
VAMKEIKNQIYAPKYIFSYLHQNWSEEVLDNFHSGVHIKANVAKAPHIGSQSSKYFGFRQTLMYEASSALLAMTLT